jgi:tetratricopeptide (TPR) repeat protein
LTREALAEVKSVAGPKAAKVVPLLEQAVEALSRDDPHEAQRVAEEAKRIAPRSSSVREVLGLALYRMGRFHDALGELQAFRRISGRPDQNHLLADSHRAVGTPEKAIPLVQEALESEIPEEARAEAAVVGGAALADLGRFEEAMALLRRFDRKGSSARAHDLRIWYVMGDVLEKAGRRSEARDRFRKILEHDPDAYDVAERLSALS